MPVIGNLRYAGRPDSARELVTRIKEYELLIFINDSNKEIMRDFHSGEDSSCEDLQNEDGGSVVLRIVVILSHHFTAS